MVIKLIFIILLIPILIIINILYNIYKIDCTNWPKGLNNTFLDNNSEKYGCQIIFPKRCPYSIFTNILDYTKFVGKKCQKFHVDVKTKNIEII